MSMLSIRAPHVRLNWPHIGFARVLWFLVTFIDVFAEAQEMARAAHKRYPFADW